MTVGCSLPQRAATRSTPKTASIPTRSTSTQAVWVSARSSSKVSRDCSARLRVTAHRLQKTRLRLKTQKPPRTHPRRQAAHSICKSTSRTADSACLSTTRLSARFSVCSDSISRLNCPTFNPSRLQSILRTRVSTQSTSTQFSTAWARVRTSQSATSNSAWARVSSTRRTSSKR